MPLIENFSSASTQFPATVSKSRPSPFSLRLTESERAQLSAMAAGRPLGSYVKGRLFGEEPKRIRAALQAIDRQELAKALALLGRSRLASNLNQLAYAVNIGSLPLTPETEQELRAAIAEVREIRQLLLAVLGMKPGGIQ